MESHMIVWKLAWQWCLLRMWRVRAAGALSHWSLLSSILTFSLVFIEMYLTYRHEYRLHVPSLKYYTIKEYLCICHSDPEIEPYQNPWISPAPRINIFVHCPASGREAALLQEPKVAFLCDTEWFCFVPHLVVMDWNLLEELEKYFLPLLLVFGTTLKF